MLLECRRHELSACCLDRGGRRLSGLTVCQLPAAILFLQCFESDQNLVIGSLLKITQAYIQSLKSKKKNDAIRKDTWKYVSIFLIFSALEDIRSLLFHIDSCHHKEGNFTEEMDFCGQLLRSFTGTTLSNKH